MNSAIFFAAIFSLTISVYGQDNVCSEVVKSECQSDSLGLRSASNYTDLSMSDQCCLVPRIAECIISEGGACVAVGEELKSIYSAKCGNNWTVCKLSVVNIVLIVVGSISVVAFIGGWIYSLIWGWS